MKLKLKAIDNMVLHTANKVVKEDIELIVDNTNIKPENIKKNISILGITGTYDNSSEGEAFSVLSGVAEPTSDIGEDGDVYFVLEE